MDVIVIALLKSLLTASFLLQWCMIIYIVSSWFQSCNPCSVQNQFIYYLRDKLSIVLWPILGPIRKVVPPIGCVDISCWVAMMVIYFIQDMLEAGLAW